MNTIDVRTPRTLEGLAAAIAVLAALTLSFGAVLAIAGEVSNAGIFGGLGDFLTQVGDALGAG